MVALVAAGVAAVTLMIGLATNAASEQQQWPGWLTFVRDNPWGSFAVLAVVAMGLAALMAGLTEPGGSKAGAVEPAQNIQSPAILRSLPRDNADFVDREDQLEFLWNNVAKANPVTPVCTIDGMAGVGKTAFAIHVGHLLGPKFPDGQLFLNLHGHTPGRPPLSPADALASLLLADGVPPQKLPNSDDPWTVIEARAAIWRARLADRKMLFIFDNAATFAQVEHLLPGGAGSLVLITSRRRLAAPDTANIQIAALETKDAAALFIRLAGRGSIDTGSVAELIAICGNLPLAISLLAGRLRHHPSWSIEDLKSRLLAAQHRLAEMQVGERAVQATFDMSYQELPPERQQFFRRLSLFPGLDVDETAAAALGDVSTHRARAELEALYSDHMLEETGRGQYRFHDLLRDYGRSLSEDDVPTVTASIERLAGHYLQVVAAANRFVSRGVGLRGATPENAKSGELTFNSLASAIAWLEAERSNIFACVDECVRLERNVLVIGLAAAMAPYLHHAGPWDQAAELHKAAAAAAGRTGDRNAQAGALENLGMVLRLMADYHPAVDILTESLAIYREVGDRAGQSHVLYQLGIIHCMTAAYSAGRKAHTEALEICREIGDVLGQANAMAGLGIALRLTGELKSSESSETNALAIYREIGDRYGEANALRDLGIVRCLNGDYAEAEANARRALAIYTEIGDPVHQGYALNELGVVLRLRGDLAGAIAAHQDALRKYSEIGDRFLQANAIHHLGVVHRQQGDRPKAAEDQHLAATIYADLGSQGGVAAANAELGVLSLLGGDLAGASSALEKASELYGELGDRCGQLEVLNHLAAVHLQAGELQLAESQFQTALGLAQELGVPLEEAHARHGLARSEIAQGRPESAAESLRAAMTIYQRLGVTEKLRAVEQLRTEVADHPK